MSERQGYGLVPTTETTLFSASLASDTSSLGVSDYNNFAFQLVSTLSGNGTSSANIYSSMDGATWQQIIALGPLTATTSSLITTSTGRRSSIQARLVNTGSITSSLYVIAGA